MKTAMVAALAALVVGVSPAWGDRNMCDLYMEDIGNLTEDFALATVKRMDAEDHKGFCAAAMDTLAVVGKASLVRSSYSRFCATERTGNWWNEIVILREGVLQAMILAGCKMPKFGK